MQASDRFNLNSQLEHLQAICVGTGHADLNRLWDPGYDERSIAEFFRNMS